MTRASTADMVTLEAHGYTVERWGSKGWTLHDGQGYCLIGEHGHVAPRQVDAVAEGLHRIERDGGEPS